MPSTRRPGYLPAGRNAPSTGSGMASADVITASKDSAGTAAAAGKLPPQGNVLSFPEPRAKRRRRLVWGTLAALAVLIAGLLVAAVYSPVLALTTVSVEGTNMLTPDQVKTALAPLQGKPLPQISDDDVTALLQPLVQVKEVTTEARPPSTLQVKVTERVPVALVKQGQTYQMVDVDGVRLSDAADPASTRLPVIDGGNGTLPKDLFRATTEVLGALPAEVLSRLASASASSVDAVELKLVDGQTIVWGNAGEKELKARVLQALLKAPADPKNPVRIYDISVPRHPVTR
ncbi:MULTISPECIES: cell division protein FtsQ/DivIB [unclassified Arthrobacter]|uniref:cell division protein FtsQ/DivIB n=1 Tax=unclassified Arthrobacter TaxID=235627 RepID=UPI002E0298A9|nr:cell division protein FtsQ [Arthrobacter sp. MP_M4]MEC5203767.1 cell division protein FtsQ [Arthrobacter sp. MP_M7]